MPARARNALAHAATPWEWRSDAAVWTLVVVGCATPVVAVVILAVRFGERAGVGAYLFQAGLSWLLFARPALRSMRRRQSLVATSPAS